MNFDQLLARFEGSLNDRRVRVWVWFATVIVAAIAAVFLPYAFRHGEYPGGAKVFGGDTFFVAGILIAVAGAGDLAASRDCHWPRSRVCILVGVMVWLAACSFITGHLYGTQGKPPTGPYVWLSVCGFIANALVGLLLVYVAAAPPALNTFPIQASPSRASSRRNTVARPSRTTRESAKE